MDAAGIERGYRERVERRGARARERVSKQRVAARRGPSVTLRPSEREREKSREEKNEGKKEQTDTGTRC